MRSEVRLDDPQSVLYRAVRLVHHPLCARDSPGIRTLGVASAFYFLGFSGLVMKYPRRA
jgi:hypothetical protein